MHPDEEQRLNSSSQIDFTKAYWHQRWEFAPGQFTPGINDVKTLLDNVQFPARIDGARVLDIGAWNGCFSFECERRGAAEVLAIGPEPSSNTGLSALSKYLNSKVRYELGSTYTLDPGKIGHFDIVLFFGVFYHLRYPLLALDNIRRVCNGTMYFESSCIDHDFIDGNNRREMPDDIRTVPMVQFYRRAELNADESNWFSPNSAAVSAMLLSSGFGVEHLTTIGHRVHARAPVIRGEPEWLRIVCGENVYYDLFSAPLLGPRHQFR